MRTTLALSIFAVFSGAIGCGGGGGNAPLEWRGTEPHFVVQGFIGGRDIDIDVDSTNAEIFCQREYVVPTVDGVPDESMALYVETEIDATFQYMGQTYTFQLELKEHDMQSDVVGNVITVVPRVDTSPPGADEIWAEFEWESADALDEFEQAAQQGTVTLEYFTGTPAQGTNIIPEGEGSIGVTVSAVWSASERLEFSITAPCTLNDIEYVE